MRCSLEYLAPDIAIARTHPEGEYGDPFTFAAVVVFREDGRVAELKGAMRAPTIPEWRSMKSLAKDLGVRTVKWDRMGPEAVRGVEIKLR